MRLDNLLTRPDREVSNTSCLTRPESTRNFLATFRLDSTRGSKRDPRKALKNYKYYVEANRGFDAPKTTLA